MKFQLLVTLITCCLFMAEGASAKGKKKKNRGRQADTVAEVEEPTSLEAEDSSSEAEIAPTGGMEAEQEAEAVDGEEEVIDLDSLEEEGEGDGGGDPHAGHGHGGHGGGPVMPKFKLFFDLMLEYEWETKLFQFTRDHAHVMLELEMTPWLTFRADIAFEPEFFEGIFHLGTAADLKLGKILVPFGQNEFHHLIGGRVDKEALFLPTVWGEYGAAFKHFAYSGDFVTFDWNFWVINGFQSTVDVHGNAVPTRAGGSLKDNNQMKGVGLRPVLGLGRSVILGTSWYLDAWDPDNENWMLIYGVDLELGYGLMPVTFLEDIRIRAEAAWSEIRLPEGQNAYHGIFAGDTNGILPNYGIRRSGYNIEISYRPIKILTIRYREGWLNDDNRVVNENDMLVHEPGILVNVGPVQFSLVGQILQRRYGDWDAHVKDDYKQTLPDSLTPEEKDLQADEWFSSQTFEYSRVIFRVLYRY